MSSRLLLPVVCFALAGLPACQKVDAPSPPPVHVVDVKELLDVLHAARGSVVVVNSWATWCQPCINETPELVSFYREHKKDRLKFVSVAVDHPDTVQERVVPFLKDKNVPFPVCVLRDRSPEAVAKTLGVDWDGGVPATFVFDRTGQLQQSWFQETTRAQIQQAVSRIN